MNLPYFSVQAENTSMALQRCLNRLDTLELEVILELFTPSKSVYTD
jgi:hypothetical protein